MFPPPFQYLRQQNPHKGSTQRGSNACPHDFRRSRRAIFRPISKDIHCHQLQRGHIHHQKHTHGIAGASCFAVQLCQFLHGKKPCRCGCPAKSQKIGSKIGGDIPPCGMSPWHLRKQKIQKWLHSFRQCVDHAAFFRNFQNA